MTESGDRVIYKPRSGERPLSDFPADSLAAREVLTFEVSEAMRLGVVPETVIAGGPLGPGAVQRFVTAHRSFDPVAVVRRRDPRLWAIAVLDIVCNNADRKLGHILEVEGRLMGVDHGLTFHPDDKLRTVLWSFAGGAVPRPLLEAVSRLALAGEGSLGSRVAELLGSTEREALLQRARDLLDTATHPQPPADRPALPWPPY